MQVRLAALFVSTLQGSESGDDFLALRIFCGPLSVQPALRVHQHQPPDGFCRVQSKVTIVFPRS